MAANKSISVICRVTEGCNLACRYCYVKPTGPNDHLDPRLVNQLLTELAQNGFAKVTLYWHGGEPLLPGKRYYRELMQIESEVSARFDLIIENKMQTNATLIDKDWARFLGENGFRVGVSLDGHKATNDENRLYPNGGSSYADAVNGLELLRAEGMDGGILSVLTRRHVSRMDEHYNLVKDLGLRSFKVNACLINKRERPELQVTPEEWGAAMISLFDLWFHDKEPPLNREFKSIIMSMFVGFSQICTFNRSCFQGFLAVVPNGDVFPCSRLINEGPEFFLGNLEEGIPTILERCRSLWRDYVNTGCSDCRWMPICEGGCTAHAQWAHGSMDRPDYLCRGYKAVFQHIYQSVRRELHTEGGKSR